MLYERSWRKKRISDHSNRLQHATPQSENRGRVTKEMQSGVSLIEDFRLITSFGHIPNYMSITVSTMMYIPISKQWKKVSLRNGWTDRELPNMGDLLSKKSIILQRIPLQFRASPALEGLFIKQERRPPIELFRKINRPGFSADPFYRFQRTHLTLYFGTSPTWCTGIYPSGGNDRFNQVAEGQTFLATA